MRYKAHFKLSILTAWVSIVQSYHYSHPINTYYLMVHIICILLTVRTHTHDHLLCQQ